jgi:NAD(P)-dependent dehydrogenase (short-subunit alcohol dehydrogenase family)
MTGLLNGRVVLVTGAGRGIGREHALLCAAEGAAVVVNDLGSAPDGTGADASPAELVSEEIRSAGGLALPNTDSVASFAGARRMVHAAIEAFGDLHVVVNNAGMVRDHMLVSMSEDDFDSVVAVHMKGTFNVTKHAADWWRAQSKLGGDTDRAIINTSSGSGLHGNVGQTNYAAAKAGIAAMTLVNAIELGQYGVRANCIAPMAMSRLVALVPAMRSQLDGNPDFDAAKISPLVVALASPGCPFNGQVFSAHGTTVGIYQGWSVHQDITTEGQWTPEALVSAMEQLPRSVPVTSQFDLLNN